jgi:hypothetical protein
VFLPGVTEERPFAGQLRRVATTSFDHRSGQRAGQFEAAGCSPIFCRSD